MATNLNALKYKYLIAAFKATGDLDAAQQICKMIVDGDAKLTIKPLNKDLIFIPMSQYDSQCVVCNYIYNKGEPIFVKDKKGWHLACGSDEDMKNSYLRTCLKKGIVEFDLEERMNNAKQKETLKIIK